MCFSFSPGHRFYCSPKHKHVETMGKSGGVEPCSVDPATGSEQSDAG